MKYICFNVNGIRARLHAIDLLLEREQPDILGLQEVKIADDIFPHDWFTERGYYSYTHGIKGRHGVAIISKQPAKQVQCGLNCDRTDSQRRFIAATYDLNGNAMTVMNGYFPQGENRSHPTKFEDKKQYYWHLQQYLKQFDKQALYLLMGDMNVARNDIDVGIGEDNAKRWLRSGTCCFLPEEREWLETLMATPFIDCYREEHPNQQLYSWFDYRSKGFDREPKRGLRIDYIFASEAMAKHCHSSGILSDYRGFERPSDHCPIVLESH